MLMRKLRNSFREPGISDLKSIRKRKCARGRDQARADIAEMIDVGAIRNLGRYDQFLREAEIALPLGPNMHHEQKRRLRWALKRDVIASPDTQKLFSLNSSNSESFRIANALFPVS